MAYTLATVITNVQRRVDSATTQDADVVAAKIGESIDEIVAAFAPQHPTFLRTEDTFTTVIGQRQYDSTDLAGGDTLNGDNAILRIRPPDTDDTTGLGRLVRIEQEEMLQRYEATSDSGEPVFYCLVGNERWWLGPVPDEAITYTMDFYKRASIPESTAGNIDLPQDIIRCAEQGAVALFKDERGDVDADIALARFEKLKDEAHTRYYPVEFEGTVQMDPSPIRGSGWSNPEGFGYVY